MKSQKSQIIKVFLVLMLVFNVITGSVFATNDVAGMIEKEPSGIQSSYLQGQLVVSVEGNSDYSIQSTDAVIEDQKSIIMATGLNVVDSLIDIVHNESTINALNIDEALKTDIINNMGYVYLVEYKEDQYDTIEDAMALVKANLTSKGLTIRYVEPNYIMSAFSMNPRQEWHYNMIEAPQAWTITNGSNHIKIAVLDTGVDNNHRSLENFVNMSLAKSFVGGTTEDVQKHGTHVSGTIASYGEVSGVMQNASIIPVKVLGDNGSGSIYGIQQGILYAASIKADVINMSLGGGGYSQGMDEACQTATNAGVVVVAAAGNSGTNVISYPAAYKSVIAVGSVDKNRKRANSSQYGAGLSVMAPGVGIYSTVPNNGYDTFSGTSMATPHVAGVVGLIRAVNGNLTPLEVRNILQTTAITAGSTNEYGYGIINAYAAVKAAGGNIVDPPIEFVIKTSMTTNKEIYKRGDAILTTATVVDQAGAPLENAKIVITLTRPNGTSASTTQQTGASGVVSSIHGSSEKTALGTYKITVVATLENYISSTSTKTIKFVK